VSSRLEDSDRGDAVRESCRSRRFDRHPSLEKLSIYLRHLAPMITPEQLNHEIDLSTVDFDYIAQHEQATKSGKPTGDVALQPVMESGTGTARDPELVALDEVIAQINDLFSGDHPDSSVRNVVTHIGDVFAGAEPSWINDFGLVSQTLSWDHYWDAGGTPF